MSESLSSCIITTLGPEGTCSESAAKYFIRVKHIKCAKIILKDNFEDCIDSLKKGECEMVIVPSAYKELNEIIFKNLDTIYIEKCYIFDTPTLVLAGFQDSKNLKILSIAAHSAPALLAKELFPEATIIFYPSNSASAISVAQKEADACITTKVAARKYGLKILKTFGRVSMSWNVFVAIRPE